MKYKTIRIGLLSIGVTIAYMALMGILNILFQALMFPSWVTTVFFFLLAYGAVWSVIKYSMNKGVAGVTVITMRHRKTVSVLLSLLMLSLGAVTAITIATIGRRHGISPNDALWPALLILFVINSAILFGAGRWASSKQA